MPQKCKNLLILLDIRKHIVCFEPEAKNYFIRVYYTTSEGNWEEIFVVDKSKKTCYNNRTIKQKIIFSPPIDMKGFIPTAQFVQGRELFYCSSLFLWEKRNDGYFNFMEVFGY